ncbi:hypothetical protein VB713_11865 [Anabaena cylindrica UHCC 0172]|uniref:hypothetical protein n=1 Tax=Anabaena cylindrica TaxID=1165 RepID=UPI002B216F71|nr:hypothetical protein [Anabaena cylindrica]MEA5551666.1 hypothetical protein [Anabaena cylindrica UHCC 0172]
MKLSQVYDSTLLTKKSVYQIDGTFYRYLYKSDSIHSPQFFFRPLAGQRKTADLKLNRNKLMSRCYLVEGMSATAEVVGNHCQLSLL